MSNDELLASIIDYGQNGPIDYGQIDLSKALRAVVELHSPDEYEPGQCSCCRAYANDGEYDAEYPCWTIQAIEKELK